MKASEEEKNFYGDDVKILKREEDMTVYQIIQESGSVEMTSYDVFDGVKLVYNDVHMQSVSEDSKSEEEIYEINHCNEGRIECEFKKQEYLYMSKGDFSLVRKNGNCHQSFFPGSYYKGISIIIYPEKAQIEFNKQFGKNKIDIGDICRRFCDQDEFFIKREEESIEHIFYELYHVPEEIRKEYFRIKILEIFLFLTTIDTNKKKDRIYYSSVNVKKVKDIQQEIRENIDRKYTLKYLSEEHDIALTSMKKCFKGVFGTSIYSYIRECRINAAAEMLGSTDKSVLNIANAVGYENGSKFSAAFKNIIGLTPQKYRESKDCCLNGAKKNFLE